VQLRCDHCGNTVYSQDGDTGILDEALKRLGWRSGTAVPASRSAVVDDEAAQLGREVAQELRDHGLDVSDMEAAEWLDEESGEIAHAPAGVDAVTDWLERKEASVAPIRRDVLSKLTRGTVQRDIAWQRTPEGLLACCGHCYEQLSLCPECGIPRTADEHRGCRWYVEPCRRHGAKVLRFPGE